MWETFRKEEVLQSFKTDRKRGLTNEEVNSRRQKYGANKLEDKPKETLFINVGRHDEYQKRL